MNYNGILDTSDDFFSRTIPDFKRFIYKEISKNSRLIGLIGAKGTGKTTLMLQVAKESIFKAEEKLYVSCDWSNMANVSLLELAKYFNAEGGKLLLIDEIHYSQDFCNHLKEIYELYPDLNIIYSGSSAVNIKECKKADLSRRTIEYIIPPLSFREYLSLETDKEIPKFNLEELLKKKREINRFFKEVNIKPLEHLKRYLIVGGFPFYKDSPKEVDFLIKMNGAISYIVDQELATIFSLNRETTNKIKEMLIEICNNGKMFYSPKEIALKFWDNENARNQVSGILEKLILSGLVLLIKKNNSDVLLKSGDQIRISHPNINFALCKTTTKKSNLESFFLSHVWRKYSIKTTDNTIFNIDNQYNFSFADKENVIKLVDKESSNIKDELPVWMVGLIY